MIEDAVLNVRRQPGDWRTAEYHWKDVRDLHWTSTGGGVRANLPHPHVHGYVMCNAMIRGELAHSCEHGPPPHEILVCITRVGNEGIWPEIERQVGPRPGTKKRAVWERARSLKAKAKE
jgi:hypothetical protein